MSPPKAKSKPKIRGPGKATEFKKKLFIEKLLEAGGIVYDACGLSGVNRKSVYRWRESDPLFASDWDSTVKTALMERLVSASHEPKNPAVLIFMGKAILGLRDGAGEVETLRNEVRELQLERERMRLVVFRATKGNPKLRTRISEEIAAFEETVTN